VREFVDVAKGEGMGEQIEQSPSNWWIVTIDADEECSSLGKALQALHQSRFAFGRSQESGVYWRREGNGRYAYVFSPQAVAAALGKGISLWERWRGPTDHEALVAQGFSLTDRAARE